MVPFLVAMKFRYEPGRWLPWAAAVLSGTLLASAFPPLEWKEFVWAGLVPLILAVRAAPPRRALTLGLVAGAVFWLLSIAWLRHVCLLYTSPSPRDQRGSRMPSSA